MPNLFSTRSAENLVSLINDVVQTAGDSPTAYGWTLAQMTELKAIATATTQAISSQQAAILNERAATQNKAEGKARAVALLNDLAAEAVKNPDVTNGMLSQIGFAPRRSTTPRPALPQTVTSLTALPNANGSVKLSWDRMGNGKATTFQVETSADGLAWTTVIGTSRASLVVSGFAPGVTAWFRVTTVNASVASAPSDAASVYAPTTPSRVQLRVA